MTTDDDEARAALEERYGVPADATTRRRRRVAALVLAVVVVAAFVTLAASWTDQPVHTEEAAFEVVDESAVDVTFVVHRDPGSYAECTVLALGDSFAQVGVAHVPVDPAEGRSTVVTARVATTEPATGARVSGCRETFPDSP